MKTGCTFGSREENASDAHQVSTEKNIFAGKEAFVDFHICSICV